MQDTLVVGRHSPAAHVTSSGPWKRRAGGRKDRKKMVETAETEEEAAAYNRLKNPWVATIAGWAGGL